MFIDYIKIDIKAGDGGNGCRSFYRDKNNPAGGPDGGNGGKGGDIIVVADDSSRSLVDFYYKRHFVAENGQMGMGNNKTGKNGENLVLKMPLGTVIKDAKTGFVVADISSKDACVTILRGGAGGRGNAKFATSTRQAPNFYETGEKVKKYEVILELKMIADVGLVGFPNVGKSTILSVVSAAKPKIADYHFTTLSPNIGVVKFHDKSFVMADIPGLIEGASEGAGLGHEFLRHIERTRLLVHVVDASGVEGRNPLEDFEIINKELCSYSSYLSSLKQIIALNKADITPNIEDVEAEFKKKYPNYEIVKISAATRQGVDELLACVQNNLSLLPIEETEKTAVRYILDERDTTSVDITRNDAGAFIVSGGYVDHISRGIVLDDSVSFAYFQKRLREDGIIDLLKKKGLKSGNVVIMGEIEFEYMD